MSETTAIVIFLASLVLSVISSLVLVGNIDKIGAGLGLSEGLLGIITALGADTPEIAAAVTALLSGKHDIGLGVVFGSNIYNIAALLGLSAIVTGSVRISRGPLLFNGVVGLLVTLLAVSLVLGWLGPAPVTLLLGVVLVPYVTLYAVTPRLIRRLLAAHLIQGLVSEPGTAGQEGDRHSSEDAPDHEGTAVASSEADGTPARKASLMDGLSTVPVLVSIVVASIGMVNSAVVLGGKWGVPDHILGILVLATLTGIPNVLAGVRLALRGRGSAVVSETLTSNSLNVLSGVALPALVLGLGSPSGQTVFAAWWLVGMTVVAVALAAFRGGVSRLEGAILIALYLVFVGLVIF